MPNENQTTGRCDDDFAAAIKVLLKYRGGPVLIMPAVQWLRYLFCAFSSAEMAAPPPLMAILKLEKVQERGKSTSVYHNAGPLQHLKITL